MAFALTGCPTGSSWTCTLMGSRLAECLEKKEIRDELHLILQSFTYHPNYGRRFLTVTLIGIILDELGRAYNQVLDELEKILHVTVRLVPATSSIPTSLHPPAQLFPTRSVRRLRLNAQEKDVMFEGISHRQFDLENIYAFIWAEDCLDKFNESIQRALVEGNTARDVAQGYPEHQV